MKLRYLLIGLPVSFAAPVTAQSASSGNCSPSATAFKTSETAAAVTSQTFVDVPGTTLHFTSGKTSCVIAQFAARVGLATDADMSIQLVLDGRTDLCHPGAHNFAASGATLGADLAAVFTCDKVAAGAHIVKLQQRRSGSLTATTLYRTTIVQYVK